MDKNPTPVLPFAALLKRYGIEECAQCKSAFNDTNYMPVPDSCGHFKCRGCFSGNQDGCSQCKDAQPTRTREGNRAIDNENCNGNAEIYQGNSNLEEQCSGLPDYSIHGNSLFHSPSYSSAVIKQESEFSISLEAVDLQTNTTNVHGLPNCTRNSSNLNCTVPSLVPLGSTKRGLVAMVLIEFPNTELQLTELSVTVKRKQSDVYESSKRGNKGKSESKPEITTNSVDTKPTSDPISSTKLDSISDLSAQPTVTPTGQKSNSEPIRFPLLFSLLSQRICESSTFSKSKANDPVTKPKNEPSEMHSSGQKSFTLPLQATKLTAIEPAAVDIDSSNVALLTTENTVELVTVPNLDICPTDTPVLSIIPTAPAQKSSTKNVSPTEPKSRKKKKRNPVIIPDHITVISESIGDPKMFQCNVCRKKFKTKGHIKYHEFCQGTNVNKPFKCDSCGQGFISKSHYEYHLRTHTGERPYVCPQCGKGFNQQGKVTRHMRSHTGEKPFICTECGRGFANAQALRSHHLIHTGERPYACKYCQKRFTGMTNLKKHVITHTGERSYVCTHCGKSFGLKSTLVLHLRTHSSERPYACDQCTRAFSSSKDLKRHLGTHSDKRPFKCWICRTSFRRKDHLDRHIKNTHNQPKEVAKQLANEAEAEYLASTKRVSVPLNKVNSAGIPNAEIPTSSESNCGSSNKEDSSASTVTIIAEVYEPNESKNYEESYILPDRRDFLISISN